ncbi:hypothetical protein ACHAW5_003151 [Stephanodiscus triporus]|uniref:Uncharacterized protein n=1 Tax=Stephanodiscus triporus TaxID=2934178 RepID=A0ABD3NRM4_9STRA
MTAAEASTLPRPPPMTTTTTKSRGRTWTDDEDAILRNLVLSLKESDRVPSVSWAALASKLPGRTGKQARDRWTNNLNPAIDRSPFTRDDDVMLFRGHGEYGKRWVEISERVFRNTRSENQVKNRWNSAAFKSFVASEYGDDAYDIANDDPEDRTRQRLVGIASGELQSDVVEFGSPPSPPPSRSKSLATPRGPRSRSSALPGPIAMIWKDSTKAVPSSSAVVVGASNPPAGAALECRGIVSPGGHAAARRLSIEDGAARSTPPPPPPPPSSSSSDRHGNDVVEKRRRPTIAVAIVDGQKLVSPRCEVPSPRGRAYVEEEDRIIMSTVLSERDFTRWSCLASTINAKYPECLPARTGKQIRDRWVNFLNPAINHRPWSFEEDVRLWEAHAKYGKRWTAIGIERFHTMRSENQIKNRWHSAAFRRFVSEEYGDGAYGNSAAISPTDAPGDPPFVSPPEEDGIVEREKKRQFFGV